MKLIFSCIVLACIYSCGIDRVIGWLHAADKAIKAEYRKAVPPAPLPPPRVEVPVQLTPRTIYRKRHHRAPAPVTLPDTLETL